MVTEASAGITLTPKAWGVVVVMGGLVLGSGGFAFEGLRQTNSVAEQQPEIQRSLARMDVELDGLKGRDTTLSERIEESDNRSKRRHERLTKDIDDLDRDISQINRVVQDLCRSDRRCRRRQRLDD